MKTYTPLPEDYEGEKGCLVLIVAFIALLGALFFSCICLRRNTWFIMKQAASIQTLRRHTDFDFITGVIQHNRRRPAKYKHYLMMPLYLYEELNERGLIDLETFYVDEQAFFEFTGEGVRISFMNLYMCEDFHRKVDHYKIVKLQGHYEITRGCSSSV